MKDGKAEKAVRDGIDAAAEAPVQDVRARLLVTRSELAKEFQVSESTIFRWLRAGLPHIKIGRLVRFKKDRVEKYLDRIRSERHRIMR